MENYFKNRISCRHFASEKISDENLKEIVSKAMHAPTCGNMQLYSVVVTRETEKLKKLATLHYNQPAASTAPVILTVCADFNRFTRWCELNGADAGYNNFHSFMTAMTDAVIFAQQIVTVAETEGLGSCYLGTVIYNAKEISDLLKLPDLVVPVAAISIGHIDEKEDAVERLAANAIIHFEEYRKDSDSDITEIFKVKDDFGPNKIHVKEAGKKNLAQVFAEVRYPRDMNEKLSESFMKLIKEKGF